MIRNEVINVVFNVAVYVAGIEVRPQVVPGQTERTGEGEQNGKGTAAASL